MLTFIYLSILIGLYIFALYSNKKVAVPDECIKLQEFCANCTDYSCLANPTYKEGDIDD